MYESGIIIRQAKVEDLDLIFKNEGLCYQFPWSDNMLKACLLNQYLSLDSKKLDNFKRENKYAFFVMFCDGMMVGHLIVHKVIDEFHLHNICVIPSFQGKKLGQKWLDYLIDLASNVQVKKIILEVRESNLVAIHLYEKNNFLLIGLRKKYYKQSNNGIPENAHILKWSC